MVRIVLCLLLYPTLYIFKFLNLALTFKIHLQRIVSRSRKYNVLITD